jgi:tetratricopeptide (TPR) repeat protein
MKQLAPPPRARPGLAALGLAALGVLAVLTMAPTGPEGSAPPAARDSAQDAARAPVRSDPPARSALGEIHFPTSGAPAAQTDFERGVLLLHSFEYDDAAAAFRDAEQRDPGFAMAYWGEAMIYNHPLWHQQDRQAALAALAKLAARTASANPALAAEARRGRAPTAREQAWLAAVETLYGEGDKASRDQRYAAAMERLAAADPGDLEAASFYALALLGTCEAGRDVSTYMRAAAVAEEVFRRNPRHPGAVHYLIHSYDDPVHAPLGLRAARIYARIAPAAAHALHMPSHIFLALGMWDDVAASNEASWAASEARRQRLRLPLDERGYHALSWLQYAYLQQGRLRDARRLLAGMAADAAVSGSARTREHLALMQAGYRVGSGQWRADLGPLPDLAGIDEGIAAAALFARGLAALRSGDDAAARRDLAAMDERLATVPATAPLMAVAVAPAVSGPGPSTGHGACHGTGYGDASPAQRSAAVLRMELAAAILLGGAERPPASDAARQAVAALERAAADEDATSYEFGPPVVVKPAHELAGEVLLDLGQPAPARRHFEQALARAPRRSLSLLGLARAASRTGDAEAAAEAYADLARSWRQADAELSELAEVTAGARRKEPADAAAEPQPSSQRSPASRLRAAARLHVQAGPEPLRVQGVRKGQGACAGPGALALAVSTAKAP